MPVYKASKYIYEAVKSIIQQTFSDFELILIDDVGGDNSIDIVKNAFRDERIRIEANRKNMGIAFSRNRGLEIAKGEYIAFMDDDDIAPINRLSMEINYLMDHPEIDAVGGRVCIIDEGGKFVRYSDDTLQNPKFIKASLMFQNPLGNGSMLFKKDVIDKYSLRFRDGCIGMEDYLFWVEFSLIANISNLKEVMLYWRKHDQSETAKSLYELNNKRMEKYTEIQIYALSCNGFSLNDYEKKIVSLMLNEQVNAKCYSILEVRKLYNFFAELINQARDKKMDNAKEIEIACRKQFLKRLEFSEIWNF